MKHISAIFGALALVVCQTVYAVNYCAPAAWGYGQNATGGGKATPTLVSTESELKSALKNNNKVIIITQDITLSGSQIGCSTSNITLMALPGAKLISNKQTADVSGILSFSGSNIILRNLTFIGPGAYDVDGKDNLTLGDAKNVWVDHCDFQDGMDGNFDISGKADNITITWCRFRYLKTPKSGGSGGSNDHRYTNLVGSDSSDKPSDGTYNITYGYCWWDEGCRERMPRCRNASLHFLNCYWNSSVANYYIGPENADCYLEGCTFEGNPKTEKIFYQNYNGKNGAKFINCTATKGLPSNVNNRTVVTPSYSYASALSAAEGKTMVTNATCGAGATLIVTKEGAVSSSCDGDAPTLYTITWDATTNGGTCSTATSSVVAGANIGTLPTAGKSGWTFKGWFTAATGGTKITTGTIPTGDVTYYAQFTENGEGPTPSGDITWNFSTSEFNALGEITSTLTIDGLTITAKSDKAVTVDANETTIDGYTFTHRLKTGGTGNKDYRSLSFSVTGKCTIEVFCCSSNSSTERTVNVYAGSYGGTELTTLPAATSATKQSFEYTGGATTIHLGSANSGVNFYGINIIYPGDTPMGIEDTEKEMPARKFLRNGQILIQVGETIYTITGAVL
ncbi:MAG: InlB B-repeat-containing protein [Paludibacteraceae bacterium]|nr:InlB B-repeat-containing protein [Paludibacteraceae bacterium]